MIAGEGSNKSEDEQKMDTGGHQMETGSGEKEAQKDDDKKQANNDEDDDDTMNVD